MSAFFSKSIMTAKPQSSGSIRHFFKTIPFIALAEVAIANIIALLPFILGVVLNESNLTAADPQVTWFTFANLIDACTSMLVGALVTARMLRNDERVFQKIMVVVTLIAFIVNISISAALRYLPGLASIDMLASSNSVPWIWLAFIFIGSLSLTIPLERKGPN